MGLPERIDYLAEVSEIMRQQWPDNRTVNVVCHGHSVPAGYFATPRVDTLNAYPHLLRTGACSPVSLYNGECYCNCYRR